ncbi:helicase-related protein, partial [Microbacterium sp. Cr-K20]
MMSAAFDLATIGAGLSFAAALDELSSALDASGSVLVTAPPGTGKTTLVPPLLASRSTGRVIVTQPRRVAVRAAARRLAHLDGSPLGSRVGFTVRGERSAGPETQVEFVTAGVLLRRMLDDPGLDGVDAVILDEVHERALETDLLIGLLSEVRELRDDLVVIAMSATLDAARIAAVIGTDDSPAPIVDHDVPAFPLTVQWAPSPVPRLDERGVTWGFLDHIAAVTAAGARDLVREDPKADVLVFAPGAREVSEIARRVRAASDAFDVRELHGQIPPAEQDAVIRGRAPADRPRIIVTTSLAESSLTVPGVRLVVDSCLSRHPQRDAGRGMTGLVTTAASRSSCVQRAGRGTRQGPGTVIRCVDERTYAAAPARPVPEIAVIDLADAALLLACWGAPGGIGLRMIDPLPAENLADAIAVLRGLGAIDDDGRATAEGRVLARIPTDPRLARALLDGSPVVGSRLAAEVVALVSGELRVSDADIAQALIALRGGRSPEARRWRDDANRLERMVRGAPGVRSDLDGVGLVIALAFPGRIAHRVERTAEGATFLLASGTRAG